MFLIFISWKDCQRSLDKNGAIWYTQLVYMATVINWDRNTRLKIVKYKQATRDFPPKLLQLSGESSVGIFNPLVRPQLGKKVG